MTSTLIGCFTSSLESADEYPWTTMTPRRFAAMKATSSHATLSGCHGLGGSIGAVGIRLALTEKCFGECAAFGANLCPDRNIVALKPDLVHFEDILHAIAGGGNRRLILRFHVVLFENHTFRVDVCAGKRNQRVAHPKR